MANLKQLASVQGQKELRERLERALRDTIGWTYLSVAKEIGITTHTLRMFLLHHKGVKPITAARMEDWISFREIGSFIMHQQKGENN